MKKSALIIICIYLSACNGDGNDSELQGNWITKSCEQATERLGSHEGKYCKGIYAFTSANTLTSSIQFYSGAACDVATDKLEPSSSGKPITYSDLGVVTLQEGIGGSQLNLILPVQDAPVTIEGFYTLTSGELCFSDNMNFNVYSFSSSSSETDSIDFEKCLVKM